jgi:putative toxin-antitoxin system antitoxin component (TIGR02293 family)
MGGFEERQVAGNAERLERVAALLGGGKVFRRALKTPLDVHEVLARGLPARSLTALFENLVIEHDTELFLEKAIGMSLRTFQRNKDVPSKLLSQDQSGRTWTFAEILAKATDVFGSQSEAEQWLERPATGLDERRPIDLLATPAGVKLVDDFLGRLEYGVYT